MTPSATPTPIPAWAPDPRPPEDAGAVGAEVDLEVGEDDAALWEDDAELVEDDTDLEDDVSLGEAVT